MMLFMRFVHVVLDVRNQPNSKLYFVCLHSAKVFVQRYVHEKCIYESGIYSGIDQAFLPLEAVEILQNHCKLGGRDEAPLLNERTFITRSLQHLINIVVEERGQICSCVFMHLE